MTEKELREKVVVNSFYVYKHTFPNGKVYIGITSQNPNRRWKNGSGYLIKRKSGEYSQPLIARAIIKYGWENVNHEIICEGLSKKEAESKEIELIAFYKSDNPEFGYNISHGGSISAMSEETKKKISESKKGEKHPMYGKHHSYETRRKISDAHKGEKHHLFGKHLSEETRRKMSENSSWNGRKHTEEELRKMSESLKGKYRGKENSHSKKVAQYDLQMNLIRIWDSVRDIERETGINHANISRCCNGKYKTSGQFVWKYIEETEVA